MDKIGRLRCMAQEALQEYQAAVSAGGEPSFPQWADDLMAVCEMAESATSPTPRLTRAAEHYSLRLS
ncbi:hypothetical protein G4G28_16475 [Massilia sp. Dwa41.01b]|uniref:hypothetical protein n=1 Tax=unclassified Massilia TaxID=2609279 RepID=UPI0016008C8C|nr:MULTISPECIES: hypothetical protein [unclassified Massilia]QNA89665.1 hypothetical protein G4G28_16475 [Massilia sp. Dwa41.01b]QNB00561.1 hypothetical protein G4G31_20055 [Massilia sp. Se16.2.3]